MKKYKVIGTGKWTKADEAWLDFAQRESMREVEVCRDAGRSILQIMSFLIPGYMAAIYAMSMSEAAHVSTTMIIPVLLWVVALALSLAVLLPWRQSVAADCPDEIKAGYKSTAAKKWVLTISSGVLVLGGMFFLVLAAINLVA